jgi:hypothetical protein
MKKDELIEKIQAGRQELLKVLAAVPPEVRLLPGATGEWSVKDTLVHLNYWGGQMVTMLYQLRQGLPLTTINFDPALDVEAVNRRWYELGKDRPWDAAWSDFISLHKQVLRRVEAFSEAELNDPILNPKLKKKPLWQWIAADTYDHDEEHARALLAWVDKRA